MKIVYCIDIISDKGGVEKVTTYKANALAEEEGNEVYIIVTRDQASLRMIPLSPKVRLINLHLDYHVKGWNSRWKNLKALLMRLHKHKKLLAEALHEIQPDIVVSVGSSEKHFLPSIRGEWKTVRELHLTSNYKILEAQTSMQKIAARVATFYNRFKIKKFDKIVLLTHEDKQRFWKNTQKAIVIPNPITFSVGETVSTLKEKRIVAAGRLVPQKNFSSLIRIFTAVTEKHTDWTLDIYGDGVEKTTLERQIKHANMESNIFLRGFSNNMREKMLNASLYVLTSVFEGFALVLVEAESCGLPIVSYACPCGPRDLVSEGNAGFLVDLNDEKIMTERICQLIEDEDLRRRMGAAAKRNSENYTVEKITAMWMELFRNMRYLDKSSSPLSKMR